MSGSPLPESRLRALLSDCTKCLVQQMYFWGRDVVYQEGNLLCENGFQRTPSRGLQGTSCYQKPWKDGYVELHGACAGWYADDHPATESFVFIRPLNRVYRYLGEAAPIPGQWDPTVLLRGDPHRIFEAASTFLDWWLHYERWIEKRAAPGYRSECHRVYQQLPAAPNWLPPQESLQWVRQFLDDPATAPRARAGGR